MAGGETVPALLASRAAEMPDGLALSARSIDGARHRLSYRDLDTQAGRWARRLAANGLASGERLGVLLTNDAALESILAALGSMQSGAAVVPMNPRWSREELAHAIELTSPSLVLTNKEGAERLAAIAPGLATLALDDGPEAPARRLDGLQTHATPGPDTLASLLFTSGTTARAKAVMHSHATMLAAGRACATALGLKPCDAYQGAFPFFTSSALNIACSACWSVGAGFVIEHQATNAERLELCAEEGTTVYHGVPSVLHFMAEQARAGGHPLPGLRAIAFGGAPMPPQVRKDLACIWPHAQQTQIYGSTESGPAGTVILAGEMESHPTGMGRPMQGYRVHLLADDGQRSAPGDSGEIILEGPGVALGYWENPEATAKTFRNIAPGRRAVRMGDTGRLAGDGILLFEDRSADRINRGGFKISSIAVETALGAQPSVLEAAVVGVDHPALGEDVAAFVVLRPGAIPDIDALKAALADRLADNAIPRVWRVLDALPRNAMGKVLKSELRHLAAASNGESAQG